MAIANRLNKLERIISSNIVSKGRKEENLEEWEKKILFLGRYPRVLTISATEIYTSL